MRLCRQLIKTLKAGTAGAANVSGNTNNSTPVYVLPRLPQFNLPTFDRTLTEYIAFWDQFKAQIDDRDDLSDAVKLQYLHSQLKDKALHLVWHYETTDTNYQHPKFQLKDMFGNTDEIKVAILCRLLDLEACRHDRQSLEKFRIEVMSLTNSLKDLHDWGKSEWFISQVIQRKLAGTTVHELHLKYQMNRFTIQQIAEGLGDLVSHLSIGVRAESPPSLHKNPDSYSKISRDQSKAHTTNVGVYFGKVSKVRTSKQNLRDTHARICMFCEGEHASTSCSEYTTLSSRQQRLKELRLCFKCCGEHFARDCGAQLSECRVCCKGKHHTALCPNNLREPQATRDISQVEIESESEPEMVASMISGIEVSNPSENHGGAALPTVMAKVVNGHRSKTTRLLKLRHMCNIWVSLK
ncbi:uncharacterized protein [Cherax quadricarinatus]|uniref:uncharacterized protein n=1 Tax=Cherax quadricarinatus TaxID=27406 RepID=UPI00387E56A4